MPLPQVILHSVTSLDGKIEGFRPEAVGHYYQRVDELGCDTWLVGSETLLAAERSPGFEADEIDRSGATLDPVAEAGGILLAVPGSRGRIRNWHTHLDGLSARGAVALVSSATPETHHEYLRRRNVPLIETSGDKVDLRVALRELAGGYGSRRIRTDSGGALNSQLLEEGLADEVSLLIAPDLVGAGADDLFRTLDVPQAIELSLLDCQQVAERFVWLRFRVEH